MIVVVRAEERGRAAGVGADELDLVDGRAHRLAVLGAETRPRPLGGRSLRLGVHRRSAGAPSERTGPLGLGRRVGRGRRLVRPCRRKPPPRELSSRRARRIGQLVRPARIVDGRRRRNVPFGEDSDADDAHLARVTHARGVRFGDRREAERGRLAVRDSPAVDVDRAPGGDQVAALAAEVGRPAVDGVAPVDRDDRLDAAAGVVGDAERVARPELAEHVGPAAVLVRRRRHAVDQHRHLVAGGTVAQWLTAGER